MALVQTTLTVVKEATNPQPTGNSSGDPNPTTQKTSNLQLDDEVRGCAASTLAVLKPEVSLVPLHLPAVPKSP